MQLCEMLFKSQRSYTLYRSTVAVARKNGVAVSPHA